MSENARKRIREELPERGVEIKDLEWLVDSFTEITPELFFDSDAVDFVRDQILEIETDSWLSKRNQSFSDLYVDPLVTDFNITFDITPENIERLIKRRKLPFSNLRDLLKPRSTILLIGEPGSGKTGCAKKIALDRLKEILKLQTSNKAKDRIAIPVYLEARRFKEITSATNLIDIYAQKMRRKVDIEVLIIDGLDEVKESERPAILSAVNKFTHDLNCAALVTTRNIEVIRAKEADSYMKYELLNLEFKQALSLVTKLVNNDRKKIAAIRKGLEDVSGQIPLFPMSLLLLVELVEESNEVPASVTELYARYIDLIFGRWDRNKGLEVLFDFHTKRLFLSELAYEQFFLKNRISIEFTEYHEFMQRYCERFGWEFEKFNDFISEINRLGLLSVKGSVIFQHRSFLDYFVATYFHEKKDTIPDINAKIIDLYFGDLWTDVTFFYIGHARAISDQQIDLLHAYPENKLSVKLDKFVSGRLLQAGWHSETKTKLKGIEKALGMLPNLRTELRTIVSNHDKKVPSAFVDFFLMFPANFSLSSTFLLKENKDVLAACLKQGDLDNLIKGIFVLRVLRDHLSAKELSAQAAALVGGLRQLNMLPDDEKRLLGLIHICGNQNSGIDKLVKKRARELAGKARKEIGEKLFKRARKKK